MELHGKPFIPPNCPAIVSDIAPMPPEVQQGFYVNPEDFRLTEGSVNEHSGLVDLTDSTYHGDFIHAWFSLCHGGDVFARVVTETYAMGTSEHEAISVLDNVDQDAAEHQLGSFYCERVKTCKGPFKRDGEMICQALDPQDFPSEAAKIHVTDDDNKSTPTE